MRRTLPLRDTHSDALLRIDSRRDADCVTLSLDGAIDIDSAPGLESAILEAERTLPRDLVLDLGALEFIDSTGIHLLIKAQRRAENNGHVLVLNEPPAHAIRLFRLTGLDSRLTIRH